MEFGDMIKTSQEIMADIDEVGYATTFRLVPGQYIIPNHKIDYHALTSEMMSDWDIIESYPNRRQADKFICYACVMSHDKEEAKRYAFATGFNWYIGYEGKVEVNPLEFYSVLGDK